MAKTNTLKIHPLCKNPDCHKKDRGGACNLCSTMEPEKIKKESGKTAIQSFADWLALNKRRDEKFKVAYSKKSFVITRVN